MNLTNPAIVNPDGSVQYFSSPVQQTDAFINMIRGNAHPLDATLPAAIPDVQADPAQGPQSVPDMSTANGPTIPGGPAVTPQPAGPNPSNFTQQPDNAPIPSMVKPTFQQATTDRYGNTVAPANPRALSKLGWLGLILKSGVQGGVDAIASGALDAVPGRSSFGAGVQGAYQAPIIRIVQQQAQQRQALENQQLGLQTQYYPQVLQQGFNKTQSEINKNNLITPRSGGVYDARTAQYAPGAEPPDKGIDPEHLYGSALQNLQNLSPADPGYAAAAAHVAQLATAIQATHPNNTKPLSKDQATALNAVWDQTALKYKLPTGQFKEGMPAADATQLQSSLNNVVGKTQNATTIVLREGSNDAMLNRNMQAAIDNTTGQEVFATPAMIQADPARYTPTRDNPDQMAKVAVAKSLAAGKDKDSIVSFNQLLGHVGAAADGIQDLRNAQSPLINKPINWLSQNAAGDPAVSGFLAKMLPVREEFANFLKNNKALKGDEAKDFQDALNENMSPAQLDAAFRNIAHTSAVRLGALNAGIKRTTHQDIPDLIEPNAQQVLQRYGTTIPDYGPKSGRTTPNPAPPNRYGNLGFIPLSQ